jgi:hypothetical protein
LQVEIGLFMIERQAVYRRQIFNAHDSPGGVTVVKI